MLWILAVEGKATVLVIVTINVIGGFVQIVDSPARQVFISRLVSPEDLTTAVSLNGVVVNTARFVGPALAGVLIVTVEMTRASITVEDLSNWVSFISGAVEIHILHMRSMSGRHVVAVGG